MVTAARNIDGSIAVVILNMLPAKQDIELVLGERKSIIEISGQAIQTIVIPG